MARQVRRFPDLMLEVLDTGGLNPREAALAHALYDAVTRRWMTLAFILGRYCDKPWEKVHPAAGGAMLAGAAQLLLLDKVPAHAALHESVEWTKQVAGKGAGGLVNAVLRRVSEAVKGPEGERVKREAYTDKLDEIPLPDGSALVLNEEMLPHDPMERLGVAMSHPVDLLRAFTRLPEAGGLSGMRLARRLALHGIVQPPVILNGSFARRALDGLPIAPHRVPGHWVWQGTHDELVDLLHARPDVWVQDPASSLAVESVLDLRPGLIVDVCAGLGTKTRQMAAAFPGARIIATDIDKMRFRTLQRGFAGHERVEVVPFEALAERAGVAELVLLDVPCSNTGVLARRVEARYRWSPGRTENLLSTQRQIIADSIRLVKRPGGRILYSTCSLDEAENEAQARWAAKWHHFDVVRERRRNPEGGPGEPAERYSDGSYAAVLE